MPTFILLSKLSFKKLSIFLLFIFSYSSFSQSFKLNRFEGEIQKLEEQNKTITGVKDLVVLYGSSSFTLWKNAKKDLAPYNVVNLGFGGSTNIEAIHYFDRLILPLKPKVIFYYEGENDIPTGFSVDSAFTNYLRMVKLVKTKLPGTKLVALSVKYCPDRKQIRKKQIIYNAMVEGQSIADPDLDYIDIVPLQLNPDGTFDPSMFKKDSIHVSELAYPKWATRMKLYLEKVFNQNEKENWVSIFNGKDFEGWEQKGGNAKYEVKEGVIIGTSTLNTPNSFMCTKKIYKDFILEFEVKVDTLLNSGVQFRSNAKTEYKEGVVHGYQCEIDPSTRAFSGGIYDEQRRGWLYKPEGDTYAQKAFNRLGWNKYRIEARGYSIKTYINDKLISDIIDTVDSSGFIGLQVHSIGKPQEEGTKVMWKNIKICEK